MEKGVKSKRLLYFALGFLILGITVFSILQSSETESLSESSFTSTAVRYSLDFDGLISTSEEKEIEHLVQMTKHISKVQIYDIKDRPTGKLFDYVDNIKSDFEYNRDILAQKTLFIDKLPSGSGSGDWYIVTERRSFHTLSVIFFFLGSLLYVILFSTWAMKNANHQKRLNVKWAFTFILFNVVGYLIFLFVDKNRTNSNNGFI
jgi:hypothetical protein